MSFSTFFFRIIIDPGWPTWSC